MENVDKIDNIMINENDGNNKIIDFFDIKQSDCIMMFNKYPCIIVKISIFIDKIIIKKCVGVDIMTGIEYEEKYTPNSIIYHYDQFKNFDSLVI